MGDFYDKTNYLLETKSLLKDRINSLGGSITSGTTFRNYLTWLDNLYTALSNKNIIGLPDSLEGSTSQTTTNGLNLWNENTQVFTNQSRFNSPTKDSNNVWTFTISGSNGYAFATSNITLQAGTYYASATVNNGDFIILIGGATQTIPFTLTEETEITFRVFKNGNVGDVVKLSNVMLNKGSSALPYTPYDTGYASPSPNHPQPINITTGRQVVSVCEKNLYTTGTGNSTRIGIDATYNKSEFTLNGTTTGAGNIFYDSSISLNTGYRKSQRLVAGTYTLTLLANKNPTFPSGTGIAFYIRNGNAGIVLAVSSLNRSYQFTLNEDTDIYSQLYCNASGIIFDNVVFNVQIEKGTTATTYKKYIGKNYEVNLGKNLLDIKNGSYSYLTTNIWEVQDHIVSLSVNDITYQGGMLQLVKGATGRWASSTDNHITNGGVYTLSISVNGTITRGTNGFITFYCYIYKSDGTTRNEQLVINNDNTYFTKTITIANDEHLGEIAMYSQFIQCENVEFKIMLEKGSQATSYTPYKTPIYLGEIRNTNNVVIAKDYIFRNTTENPYYNSDLEEGQWYIHKEIGKVVVNGTESGWMLRSNTSPNYIKFRNDNIFPYYIKNRLSLISNYFVANGGANDAGYSGNAICGNTGQYAKWLHISIDNTIVSDVATFKTWLGTHNLEIYYILATPTNTLIEDEELINQLNEIEIFTVISEDFYN